MDELGLARYEQVLARRGMMLAAGVALVGWAVAVACGVGWWRSARRPAGADRAMAVSRLAIWFAPPGHGGKWSVTLRDDEVHTFNALAMLRLEDRSFLVGSASDFDLCLRQRQGPGRPVDAVLGNVRGISIDCTKPMTTATADGATLSWSLVKLSDGVAMVTEDQRDAFLGLLRTAGESLVISIETGDGRQDLLAPLTGLQAILTPR